MDAAAGRHLTLLVPGLFGPALVPGGERVQAARMLCEGLAVPALEGLLSRAVHHVPGLEDESPEALAFASFGVMRDGPDWPVAAITYRYDGGDPAGVWMLRADPVSLRADMGDVTLFDASALHLEDEEGSALAAEVDEHVTRQGLHLEAPDKTRWYLRGCEPQALRTWPLSMVSGAHVGGRLPSGDDARPWAVLSNEIQMILHASPVNRRREDRGLPPVNGVWLWGGGCLPPPSVPRYATVWSDDPLVVGLAGAAGSAHRPAPRDAGDWLSREPVPGEHLGSLLAGHDHARHGDLEAWRGYIEGLERAWAAPLLAAMAQRRIAGVTLRTGRGGDFRVTRRDMGRWWRRRRDLAGLVASWS